MTISDGTAGKIHPSCASRRLALIPGVVQRRRHVVLPHLAPRWASQPGAARLHPDWISGLILVSLLLYGCGGELRAIALQEGEIRRLANEPVILSATYPPPDFVLSSWNLPPGEQRRRGSMITTAYGLVDPVSRLQARFLSLLESTLGLKNVRRVESNPGSDQPPELKRLLGDAMVLDFKTVGWGVSPPERTYFVGYGARARLVDLGTLTVLWQGWCRSRVPT